MKSKVFSIVFSRGSGLCVDESCFILVDTDLENVKKRVEEYYNKYFSKGGWYVSIIDLSEKEDEFGFSYVTGYNS